MIQWLLCHILGHKTVYKAFNGKYIEEPSEQSIAAVYLTISGQKAVVKKPLMELRRSAFCLRCGNDMKRKVVEAIKGAATEKQ